MICCYFSRLHKRAEEGNQLLILSPFWATSTDDCWPKCPCVIVVSRINTDWWLRTEEISLSCDAFCWLSNRPFFSFSFPLMFFEENIFRCLKNLHAKKNLIICLLLVRDEILNFLLLSSKTLFVQHISIQNKYAAHIFSLKYYRIGYL